MQLLRVYLALISLSVRRQLAFRTDLVFEVLATLATVVSSLAAILVLFTRVGTIGGFDPASAVVLLGSFHVITGLRRALVEPNLRFIGNQINDGTFDGLLLQPAPVIFLASLGGAAPLALSQTIVGVITVVAGVVRLDTPPSGAAVGCWLIMISSAAVVMWATRCLTTATIFWSLGLTLDVAYDAVWQAAPYPTTIFNAPIKIILTYLLPVAFLATIPAGVLTGTAPLAWTAAGPIAAVLTSAAAIAAWRAGLARYSSATS